MTNKEAAVKLAMHLHQCGLLMPEDWLEKNGEGSELERAFQLAIDALKREEPAWISEEMWDDAEIISNIHDNPDLLEVDHE